MSKLWLVVVFGALITYLERASFLMIAERFTGLPPRVETVLRMIPPAALAAIIAPAMLRVDGSIDLINPVLAGGIAALALAIWKRGVLGPLVLGFGVTTAVGLLLG